MARAYVDEDMRGEVVRWYRSKAAYESQQVSTGPCPHDCRHRGLVCVGWGGDLRHYEVVRCYDCNCRAWLSEEPPKGAWGWRQTREETRSDETDL